MLAVERLGPLSNRQRHFVESAFEVSPKESTDQRRKPAGELEVRAIGRPAAALRSHLVAAAARERSERIPGESRDWVLKHVRAGKDIFRREIESAGFEFEREVNVEGLKENYVLRFRRL